MRFSRLSADKQRNFTRSGNPGCPSVTKIWCTPKGGKHSTAPWWSQKAFPAVAEDITVDPVEVAAPAEAAAEAAPLLAEDITLDDRSAELTAPAEVPERTTEDDVAEEPVKSPKAFPAVAEDITVDPFEVAAPAEAAAEAAPALAEDITLDDRSAELTAPAEVPESTTEDDVAEEPVKSPKAFPAVAEDITVDDSVEVAAPAEAAAEAVPAAEDITLDDRSAELTAPAEVPESTTEDDVAEEPVKSPKAFPAVAEDITVDDPVEVAAPAEGERECRDVLYAMQSLGKDQDCDSDAESTVASQGPTEVEDWFGEFAAFHREDYW